MSAKSNLRFGAEHPYDADEDGNFEPPKDWAHAAARGVLADLCGRRGVKSELEQVDDETRAELTAELAATIRAAPDFWAQTNPPA